MNEFTFVLITFKRSASTAAGKMTGRFNFCRHIQLRTLRKQHDDQHWVNALTKYHKDWAVDVLNAGGESAIRFVGQDDKSKIPVGDHVPVSTGVHIKNKGIVPVDRKRNTNRAADQDFSKGNIVTSVTLIGNIPSEYGGSFYGGGEDGHGEIHTVLASNMFDHNAQLFAISRSIRAKSIVNSLLASAPDDNVAHESGLTSLSSDLLIVERADPSSKSTSATGLTSPSSDLSIVERADPSSKSTSATGASTTVPALAIAPEDDVADKSGLTSVERADRSLESITDEVYALLVQTDGGPDHNLTFFRSKLAHVALFLILDLDHLCAIRGAPHGSYLNTVERAMSLLNLGLQNLALIRKPMPEWAESAVTSVGSMKGVRNAHDALEKKQNSKRKSKESAIARGSEKKGATMADDVPLTRNGTR